MIPALFSLLVHEVVFCFTIYFPSSDIQVFFAMDAFRFFCFDI